LCTFLLEYSVATADTMASGIIVKPDLCPAFDTKYDSAPLIATESEDNPPDAFRRTRWSMLVGLSLVLLSGLAGVRFLGASLSGMKTRLVRPELREIKSEQLPGVCGLMERNVDYKTNHNLYMAFPIPNVRRCQSKCINEPRCAAWTWGKKRGVRGLSDVCMLKGLQLGELPLRSEREGTVSGLICSEQRHSRDAEKQRRQATTTAVSTTPLVAHTSTTIGMGNATNPSADSTAAACSDIEADTEYWTNNVVSKLAHVASAAICRVRCEGHPRCSIWTWVRRLGGAEADAAICWLRRLEDGELLRKRKRPGVFSGCTEQRLAHTSQENATKESSNDDSSTSLLPSHSLSMRFPDHFHPGSLYCFAVMRPIGYEPGLIRLQYQHKASIFGCEEYAVYSDRIMDVVPGLRTYVVNSSLECEVGGEFRTALNLDIFLAVWAKVVVVNRYTLHDWTVKVDPDSVFFPSRLHATLDSRQGGDHAVYINNCKLGMHGPLEVFSRKAVKAWSEGAQHCHDHFTKLCSGDCHWGEDFFIDQCLMRILKIKRISDFDLLVEEHCDPEEGWDTCRNQSKAAFHPFKNEDAYLGCLKNASAH